MSATERSFTLTRVYDAPRAEVFDAWIDPDRLARWFGPRGVHTPRETITVDPAVGGELRLTMVDDASGAEYPVLFRFTELVEPELLVFNTSTIADPHSISEQSVVTVTFADLGDDTTELTLHAVGYTATEEAAGVEAGWGSQLDRLQEAI